MKEDVHLGRLEGLQAQIDRLSEENLKLRRERDDLARWAEARKVEDKRIEEQAEKAVHASEERLRRVVSIDTVGVLFFSLDGRLHDANHAFERMSGYTLRELVVMECWMALTVPEFVGVTERIAADLAERGTAVPYEKQMIRKDGSHWWGLFAPTRLSGSGRESKCVEFIIDITQQKQAEAALIESEQRYRNLFKKNNAVMLLIEPSTGSVVDANSAACTYYGYDLDEITALKITEINILSDVRAKVEMEKAKSEQQGRFNFQHRLADGRIRDVEVFSGPIEVGGRELLYSIVHDVTDRRKAEEANERLNAQLAERARELADANRELETFNYSVAHDLRTPLTAISGYLELTKQGCEITAECRQYLQRAHEGILKMEQLIDGLLEFSRVSRKESKRQEIDLGAMAQEVVDEMRAAEPERRVALRITDDGMADGDPALMRVVLTNLLGNAWKYTRMREQAQIEFDVKKQDGRKIFFVRDNGPGFEMAEAEKLFTPFQRLSGAADFRGHGIGLATVARIIDRHGGRIWADGEPGKGATFYFTLPSSGN